MKKRVSLFLILALLLSFACMVPVSAAEDFEIPMAAVKPTMDGIVNPGEWRNAAEIDISSVELVGMITNAPTSILKKGSMFYMMWDSEYLYCGAHVLDSTKPTNQPLGVDNAVSGLGDGFQFVLFANSESAWAWEHNKLLWTVCPWTGENAAPVIWKMNYLDAYTGICEIAGTVRDDGYDVEFSIPWSAIAEAKASGFVGEYAGEAGDEIFFMICVLDASGNSQNMSLTADNWGGAPLCDKMILSYDEAGGEYADATEDTETDPVTSDTDEKTDDTTAKTEDTEPSDATDTTGKTDTDATTTTENKGNDTTAEAPADQANALPWILIAVAVVVVAVVVVIIIKKKKA